jgi:predicted nucleic acid-binding protein
MIKVTLKIVCDSGPIIHLDELNCLYLLEDFQEILIPETVHKEIKRYRPSSFKKLSLPFNLSPGNIPDNAPLLTLCRIFSLDVGETEALALMEKNPQAIFLTDDASARMVAEQMRFKVHGTMGILIRAIRRGQMETEEVLRILKEVPSQTTLYIKLSLLDEIILKIKKEYNL